MTVAYRIMQLAQDDLEAIWLYTREQWCICQIETIGVPHQRMDVIEYLA